MMTPYQITENIKMCIHSTLLQLKIPCVWLFGLNHWMKAGVKPNNMVIPILSVHRLSHISGNCCGLKHQEYSHTFYRVTPNMCIIYRMRNDYLCWLFLVAVDIIRASCRKWLNCLFVRVLYWVAAMHQVPWFHNHLAKKRSFVVPFMVSRVNDLSEWIWCTETLQTYHMYLFWHDRVWRHRLRHMGWSMTSCNIFP